MYMYMYSISIRWGRTQSERALEQIGAVGEEVDEQLRATHAAVGHQQRPARAERTPRRTAHRRVLLAGGDCK